MDPATTSAILLWQMVAAWVRYCVSWAVLPATASRKPRPTSDIRKMARATRTSSRERPRRTGLRSRIGGLLSGLDGLGGRDAGQAAEEQRHGADPVDLEGHGDVLAGGAVGQEDGRGGPIAGGGGGGIALAGVLTGGGGRGVADGEANAGGQGLLHHDAELAGGARPELRVIGGDAVVAAAGLDGEAVRPGLLDGAAAGVRPGGADAVDAAVELVVAEH